MSDFEALVEKAAAAMIHLRWPETERVQPGDRQVARAALDAIGLPALLERVEAAEGREFTLGEALVNEQLQTLNAMAERDALAAKVARVDALHHPVLDHEDNPRCDDDGQEWPCTTHAALTEGTRSA